MCSLLSFPRTRESSWGLATFSSSKKLPVPFRGLPRFRSGAIRLWRTSADCGLALDVKYATNLEMHINVPLTAY